VNNAAISTGTPRLIFTVNFFNTVELTELFIAPDKPVLKKRGKIVTISSCGGLYGTYSPELQQSLNSAWTKDEMFEIGEKMISAFESGKEALDQLGF